MPRPIQVLIATATILNLLAVWLPFVEFDIAFRSPQAYTLTTSIGMLWDANLAVLAVLVTVFSLVFPFTKLAVLAWASTRSPEARAGSRLLAVVGTLGRWSLLDAFLVCLLLALTDGQYFVSTRPLPGLVCFLGAVLLSLTASELLHGPEDHRLGRSRGGSFLFALLAGLALAAAQLVPALQIDSWLLKDQAFSLVRLVPALWHGGAFSLAVTVAALVLVVPWLRLVLALALIRTTRGGASSPFLSRWANRLARWDGLEVFALALGIFLLEGRQFVPTTLGWGAPFLGVALVLHAVALRLALRRE